MKLLKTIKKLKKNNILTNTFYQLLFIYFILILFISFKQLNKYSLHFEVYAISLGILSLFVNFSYIKSKTLKQKNKLKLPKWTIIIPIIILIIIRTIPYITNSVPLGYDPGIYKYSFETYAEQAAEETENNWVMNTVPAGLPSLISYLYILGYNNDLILTFVLTFFEVVNLLMIYAIGKQFFNKEAGILSTFFYSISTIQLLTFWFNYYKNIVAISTILLAIYLISRKKTCLGTLIGGFLGGLHKPTFLIYGITHFLYWLKNFKKRIFLSGLFILIIALGFYTNNIYSYFLEIGLKAATSIGQSTAGGTFVSSKYFHFSTLAYLALGIIGFFNYKKYNQLSIWLIIVSLIVYLKFFFFKRFIIHLNIIIIVFTGYGLYIITKKLKKPQTTILLILIFLASISQAFYASNQLKPLIYEEELDAIKWISKQDTEYVMVLHKHYSPWAVGWSNKKTIAPGLFDTNKWDYPTWTTFWQANSSVTYNMIKSTYGKDVLIYQGKIKVNKKAFENEKYFEKIYKQEKIEIYRLK